MFKKGDKVFIEAIFLRTKKDHLIFNVRDAELGFYKNDLKGLTNSEKLINKLQKDLALAREGLEFYGDADNYMDVYYGNYGLISEDSSETCGFKAREILSKLDKKDGEK